MLLCSWAAGLALAGHPSIDAPSASSSGREATAAEAAPAPDPAEYHRLSLELEALVARNAWAGVERTFQDLLATGVAPSYQDWMRGAESARLQGNIQEVYDRLLAAKDLSDDNRTAVEWLWELDHTYGRVMLACDLGSDIVLDSDQTAFDPDQARAIEFAQQRIRDTCSFDGRLPAGTYRFYGHTVEVEPMLKTSCVDLRGTVIPRGERRDLKRAHDEQAAAAQASPSQRR